MNTERVDRSGRGASLNILSAHSSQASQRSEVDSRAIIILQTPKHQIQHTRLAQSVESETLKVLPYKNVAMFMKNLIFLKMQDLRPLNTC